MSSDRKQPYFFGPVIKPEQSEDGLYMQKLRITQYNNLVRLNAVLELRFSEINSAICVFRSKSTIGSD